MKNIQRCSVLIMLLCLWKHDFVQCVRILELRVPGHAMEGGEAILGCQFDLEDDHLYSVKWYKNDKEFYRYVPSNDEPTSYFPIPGVFVDLARSSSTIVALKHLTKDSGGRYKCEVSGETPYFVTAAEEKDVKIYLLPNRGPRLSKVKPEYEIGENLSVNCTSSRSRPKTHIKWLLNNHPAPESYLRGPWEWVSRERRDAIVTTLELDFLVMSHLFIEGVLTIECQAVLAPLYYDRVIHHILRIDDTIVEETSNTIPQIYEASVLSASSKEPETEPRSEEVIGGDNMATKKYTAWAVITSILFAQLIL